MKRILTLALFLCLALTAWASSTVVTVAYQDDNLNGPAGPYDLTINGAPVLAPCLTADLTLNSTPWKAVEVSVVDFADPFTSKFSTTPVDPDNPWPSYFASQAAMDTALDEAVYLDTQFAGQTSVNVTAIQEAIWDLLGANPQFATTKTVGGVTTNTLVGSWIKTAATDYSGLSQSFLSGYSVVIPVTVAKDGSVAEVSTTYPQWFLVATPEPGAIYMVLGGIGLIGMGRIVRRKRSA